MKETLDDESRQAIVIYRLQRAKETLEEIDHLIESGYYNTAINRLYYACFYTVSALLLQNKINSYTHAGVKQMFGLHFISTGKVKNEYGRFYSDLFKDRQSSDYEDFIQFDEEISRIHAMKAKDFIHTIEELIVNR